MADTASANFISVLYVLAMDSKEPVLAFHGFRKCVFYILKFMSLPRLFHFRRSVCDQVERPSISFWGVLPMIISKEPSLAYPVRHVLVQSCSFLSTSSTSPSSYTISHRLKSHKYSPTVPKNIILLSNSVAFVVLLWLCHAAGYCFGLLVRRSLEKLGLVPSSAPIDVLLFIAA